MTDHDLQIARDVGALQADVRTVKHDVANISSKLDSLSLQINNMGVRQAKGLGFFAGAAFILTGAGGLLLAAAKMLFGGHG
ncbi:hypothetical protein [Rhizorhapis suberifaciens]|uniref:Uncharacterized protein n=1 Tax=Rhizorhapis suberifaciens TaxID=13656 RepID=A0A840HXT9_9SPHN|nr:hypothetical protein [Rhizorhapis suberifaciens]MBB4642379.1 hypothetical protein [Rhizorhapis suberifaciens]